MGDSEGLWHITGSRVKVLSLAFDMYVHFCYNFDHKCTFMIKFNNNIILTELMRQNPWWSRPQFKASEPIHHRRDMFPVFLDRVKNRELITSLVGLRRVGKSTLIRQIIDHLLQSGQDPKTILYFLFEESLGKNTQDTLRQILDYQIQNNPHKRIFFFFDEIQYVDGWNSLLKFYFDTYPHLKFVVSGSASLFIRTKATESLAGRIQELVLRPMGYGEYLRIHSKTHLPEHFLQYLAWGEFPYLEKLPDWAEKKEYVHDFIIKKVVEHDLPKLKKIYGSDLSSLLNILIARSGQIVEIQNLSQDLGIAQNTVREYLGLLEKTYLVSQVFNLGIGFRTRSTRQRKIYASSVNAVVFQSIQGLESDMWQQNIGYIIETFVYNYLLRQQSGDIHFFRQRQVKEVDFIQLDAESKLPIEVKYQNVLRPSDLDTLLYYCKKERLNKAVVVTKNEQSIKKIDGVEISFKPAHTLL